MPAAALTAVTVSYAPALKGVRWRRSSSEGESPGQTWLWRYTVSYQVEPFKASENADILVMLVMGVLSLAFICIPFIPGVRSIPRHIPLYRLIWREHYRERELEA